MKDREYFLITLARLRAIRASVISNRPVEMTIVRDFNDTLEGLGKKERLFLALKASIHQLSELDRARMTLPPNVVGFPANVFLSRVDQAVAVLESFQARSGSGVVDGMMLTDEELSRRVGPLLSADDNFDIVINQATQLLEVRLRILSGYDGRDYGANLVSKVLNGNPVAAILRVSDDPSEQEGFANLCRGVMQFLRNSSHHYFKEVTKDDARKVCMLVDYLLTILASAKRAEARVS